MEGEWHVERLDLSDVETAVQVLQVQRAAYRVEAELIGFDGIPPLHESYEELIVSSMTFLSASGATVALPLGSSRPGEAASWARNTAPPQVGAWM